MGKAEQARQRALRGRRLDRLRRPQVALVLHLRADRACSPSAGLYFKGLNFGIEFEGGVEYNVSLPADQVTQDNVDKIRTAVADTGIDAASSPIVNTSGESDPGADRGAEQPTRPIEVTDAIAEAVGVDAEDDISTQDVGASWGEQVAKRALTGLVVFLVLVVLFIWAYFREWKMSVGRASWRWPTTS